MAGLFSSPVCIACHTAHEVRPVHRVFSVLLTNLFFCLHVAQIFDGVVVGKDRRLLWGSNSLIPQPQDIVDLYRNSLWFFGLGVQAEV